MAIEQHDGGGMSITGKRDVGMWRLDMLVSGLKFEIATKGKGRLSRGVNCWMIAKKEFNLKGNREKVLAQLEKIVEQKWKDRNLQAMDEEGRAHENN